MRFCRETVNEIGTKVADGSIYAGLTENGKYRIFAMASDLSTTMTFNNAAKAVKALNADKALGYDDWQIPTREQLKVLSKNKDEGALKGTFTTQAGRGSDYPDWYWSSTEGRGHADYVYNVRLSDGVDNWTHKDFSRLSCRPVRLVASR